MTVGLGLWSDAGLLMEEYNPMGQLPAAVFFM
jgi:hypothetical protein